MTERPKNLTKVLHCRVPEEIWKAAQVVAIREGRKPAGWFRRQIELGLRKASLLPVPAAPPPPRKVPK